jgi:hypothetical protein
MLDCAHTQVPPKLIRQPEPVPQAPPAGLQTQTSILKPCSRLRQVAQARESAPGAPARPHACRPPGSASAAAAQSPRQRAPPAAPPRPARAFSDSSLHCPHFAFSKLTRCCLSARMHRTQSDGPRSMHFDSHVPAGQLAPAPGTHCCPQQKGTLVKLGARHALCASLDQAGRAPHPLVG